ncbi:MAG: hypothetical protein ACK559_40275, partial [bacterium]
MRNNPLDAPGQVVQQHKYLETCVETGGYPSRPHDPDFLVPTVYLEAASLGRLKAHNCVLLILAARPQTFQTPDSVRRVDEDMTSSQAHLLPDPQLGD